MIKKGDLWFCSNDLIIKTKDGNKVATYSTLDVNSNMRIDGIYYNNNNNNNTLYVVESINNKKEEAKSTRNNKVIYLKNQI